MQKLTITELGWVCCAINAEVVRYEREEKENPFQAERAFAHLRKDGLQSVWERLHKAYMDEDKRIALEDR